jgi:hypothetical protein
MAAALPSLANEAGLFFTDDEALRPLIETTPISTSATIRQRPLVVRSEPPSKSKGSLEIRGVFRGRELTRKERRLTCGIAPVDRLIGGGIVRGRISEIVGNSVTAGKTSLAAAFAGSVTARGEVAAWIDANGGFDPASIAAAGVDLARMLWVAMPAKCPARRSASTIALKAAEWVLTAGGFGLVVIDCGGLPDFNGRLSAFTQSAALRLAHGAERSGAAVMVIAPHRMCGTFAALSLMLSRSRACFSRTCRGAPVLFDGLTVEARVMRNKLGGSGDAATWSALVDPPGTPSCTAIPESVPASPFAHPLYSHDLRKPANHDGQRAVAH